MLIKIFVRTFPSTEDCELFESILETRWPNLLQEVKGVRFRAMKKIKKLIEENIAKYVKIFAPKTVNFVGAVKQDFGETSF
jgi:hypothetical protein